jgi:N-acetylneuraminic acid mutarotase
MATMVQQGGDVKKTIIDGVEADSNIYGVEMSTLPYDFCYGCAVVYNNEIHILGSNTSGNGTKHYKWDGTQWTSVSTLPYNFYDGSAVVLSNKIHILGGDVQKTNHYKIPKELLAIY